MSISSIYEGGIYISNLKIICDSLSDIPKNIRDEYDIEMVSLTVRFGEDEYRDGIDLSS